MSTSIQGDFQLYLRLLRFVRPYWRLFVISLLAMVVVSITSPALAALMQPMFDDAFIERDPQVMVRVPLLLVLVFGLRAVATFVSGGALHLVANRVILDLRAAMFARLTSFPIRYFDRHTAGTLMSRFTYDVAQIKEASTHALTVLVRDSLSVIGLLAWMFYIDWGLTLAALVAAPLIMLVVMVIRRRLRRMSHGVQETMGDLHHVLDETLHATREMKLYAGQQQAGDHFYRVADRQRRFSIKFGLAAVAGSPLIQIITALALAAIMYLGARQAMADAITVGAFVSFFTAMALILAPLRHLASVNEHLQRGLAACDTVFALLDAEPETDNGTIGIGRVQGDIKFEQVRFSYDAQNEPALCDIDLHIRPGESVALVGASGSGKTTLVNLLPRFYEPVTGSVLIDDHDIRDLTLDSLRANIAMVRQDVVLLNDTVRNNIAFGSLRKADDKAVHAAAEAAQAMDFIDRLPQGMDTVIGGKGMNLSGGQRQRLAIARALLKDAPILILDEATSALDSKSERQFQLAMEAVMKGRTCIIIAHRLSTVKQVDRIIVLDHGRIAETGSHDELLRHNGLYAHLHTLQMQ